MGELYEVAGREAYAVAHAVTGETGAAEHVVETCFAEMESAPQTHMSTTAFLRLVHRAAVEHRRARDGRPPRRTGPPAAALSHLTATEQEVVDRAYLGGLTRREIAVELDLALGTVDAAMHSALVRLSGDQGQEVTDAARLPLAVDL